MLKKTPKITLKLEMPDGRYVTRNIPKRMICSLFDFQYMVDDGAWETAKLNEMDKHISDFFRIVEFIDSASDDNLVYKNDKNTKKVVTGGKSYMFGKPQWKRKK